ncbi:hypothetical protein F0919_17800 [Taibaiella lutea]|uniref:Uncharacterized protein n=1 Tax=Taibaiella lutea TaxID=2608001 RepID=A0A5M6CBX9_9BACT|nr:hypothetical protein [Taibaiella lutea]KAA5532636.1 hypothetical protein F0919_17800 [Taibaiella lutea]
MKYQDLCSQGKGIQDLSSIERIIIGAPIFTLFQEWLFRKRLLAVLKESFKEPESYVKFEAFIERYPKTENGRQQLAILLSDARIDFRIINGYTRRKYN